MILMTDLKNKVELKRVNMNLPSDLVQKVINYANTMGLNTTSAYIVLLNQALDQKETIDNMPIILELFKNELAKVTKTEDESK